MPFVLYYVYLVNDLIREKSKKLRLGICVMGISHRVYWVNYYFKKIKNTSI